MKKNKTLFFYFFVALLDGCAPKSQNIWIIQEAVTKERLRGISAVSEQVVWASGNHGTCIRTTNGGLSWEKINIPDSDSLDFRDIEAFGPDEAYVLSIGYGRQSRVYKTTDGGKSWQLQFLNTDTTAFFDAFAFWNSQEGIAVSDAVNGRWILVSTHDGGARWNRFPSQQAPLALSGEGAFAASGTCITTYGDSMVWIGSGVNAARVLSSNDRGKNWRYSETPITHSNGTSGIFSIAFYNEKKGVVCGGDFKDEKNNTNSLAFTANQGITWQIVNDKLPQGFRSSILWLTDKILIAVGPNGSDISYDSGMTWNFLGDTGFHTADAGLYSKTIWAAGDSGRVGKLNLGI